MFLFNDWSLADTSDAINLLKILIIGLLSSLKSLLLTYITCMYGNSNAEPETHAEINFVSPHPTNAKMNGLSGMFSCIGEGVVSRSHCSTK